MTSPLLDNKKLSEKIYKALDWAPEVYARRDFPFVLAVITYGTDNTISVILRFKDGEEMAIVDPAAGFPSQELLAQINVLAGSQSRARAEHRRHVQDRVERERQRSKYSRRPW